MLKASLKLWLKRGLLALIDYLKPYVRHKNYLISKEVNLSVYGKELIVKTIVLHKNNLKVLSALFSDSFIYFSGSASDEMLNYNTLEFRLWGFCFTLEAS